MTSIPDEQLSSILQTISVLVDATAVGIPLGDVIPTAHVRKITRIHVRESGATTITLFQGDVTDTLETTIDSFNIIAGNPDHVEKADKLSDPLIVIRPDEARVTAVPPAVPDEVNNIVSLRRVAGADTQVTISFYDDRQ